MRTRVIYSEEEKNEIINKCDVCRVAMVDENGLPYLVCMSFAFDGTYLYLHSGPIGKKINILQKNNKICVEFSTDYQSYHQDAEVACSHSIKYRSVLLHGAIEFIDNAEQKVRILNLVMKKYTGKTFSYNAPAIKNVCVMRVFPSSIEGKAHGY